MPKTKIIVEMDFEWNGEGTWHTHKVTVGPELDKDTLYGFFESDEHFFGLDDALYDHMSDMED
jgi:hypothetical protein